MIEPKVGMTSEYYDDKVVVTAVDRNRKTMDLNYHDSNTMAPKDWDNRPWSELVDMGEDSNGVRRVIWNHE